MNKWVLVNPRQRKMPSQAYVALVVAEGTEKLITPQIILWSNNMAVLNQIVNEHNQLIELKEQQNTKK
jgi:hypothetical protein